MEHRPVCLHRFLQAQKPNHNNAGILDLYDAEMECQTNVACGKGQPVEGKRNTYSDGTFEWYNFRVGSANDARKLLTYPLDLYAHEIGLSGWNWKRKLSLWLGFDFDDLTSHAPGIGISKEELFRIKEAVSAIPWIEVRRSTGGGGLHLVVHLEKAGIPTEDHAQHAALARCVLGMISTIVGFDLSVNVDCCGGILWVWSRRATPENLGFAELKPATATLSESELPSNWRDYIDVVTQRRAKVRVRGVADEHEDAFDALASAFNRVPLDDKHKEIIDELLKSGFTTIWVPDHHLLQTHTVALKRLLDDPAKRKALGLVGILNTVSQGRNPGTPNCFMVPLPSGAWKVFRFSPGMKESSTWNQDGKDWTTCFFNRQPSLPVAAQAMGGVEDADIREIEQWADLYARRLCGGEKRSRSAEAMKAALAIEQIERCAKPRPAYGAYGEGVLCTHRVGHFQLVAAVHRHVAGVEQGRRPQVIPGGGVVALGLGVGPASREDALHRAAPRDVEDRGRGVGDGLGRGEALNRRKQPASEEGVNAM